MPEVPVAIIGGGISGLAAAYELARRDIPFVLLERASRLGGVILTEQVDGFTLDAGPDALLVQKPAAVELCRELGLADRLVATLPPRVAYVVRNGVLHPLPAGSVFGLPTGVRSLLASRLLSWPGKLRMGLEVAIPRRREPVDESVAGFFRRRFGNEAVAYLAEPLLAGIHAGDVDRLSMQALFPRFLEAERTQGSVLRAFRQLAAERAAGPDRDGLFRSLAGGLGTLVAALGRVLPSDAVRCGDGVRAVTGPGPYTLTLASGATLTARQVVCAVPAHAAAGILEPVAPRASALCAAIPYTSMTTVVLAYPRAAVAHPLAGTGFVVPRAEPDVSITAGTWISSKWPGRAPDGHVLLRGFVGGARAPDALDAADEALVDTVRRDFGRLLGLDAEPVLTRVYRWPRANPQPHVGHLDRVAEIDACLADRPGLHLIGAALRGVGIPDCVAAGRAAGRAAAGRHES